MKKMLLYVAMLLTASVAVGQEVAKTTFHYATHQGQELLLDRYSVEGGDEARPCMIFAFGGGFVGGQRDHEYYSIYFDRLAKAGIVVVSIDYRLGLKDLPSDIGIVGMIGKMQNAVTIAVEDIYCATNFVVANAGAWGVDTSKIMLSGSSAGAIASLQAEWMRCNGDERATVLPEGFRYAGVVSCAGAIFTTHGKPKFDAEPAPMLLFHGTSDSNVPYNKASVMGVGFYGSKYVAKQLKKIDAPYYFYSAEYVDHILAGTPLWERCDLILQFIEDYVIEGRPYQQECVEKRVGAERRPTHFTVKEYLSTNYKRK